MSTGSAAACRSFDQIFRVRMMRLGGSDAEIATASACVRDATRSLSMPLPRVRVDTSVGDAFEDASIRKAQDRAAQTQEMLRGSDARKKCYPKIPSLRWNPPRRNTTSVQISSQAHKVYGSRGRLHPYSCTTRGGDEGPWWVTTGIAAQGGVQHRAGPVRLPIARNLSSNGSFRVTLSPNNAFPTQ